MMLADSLKQLYETLSNDMKITQFEGEDIKFYHYRLVYSALGKWIMTLFLDRDLNEENDVLNQVSQMHVTISAINIINTYKKLDSDLVSFFDDERDVVNSIEEVYYRLGYINKAKYSFKTHNRRARIAIANKTLLIDLDSSIRGMRGLGLWSKNRPDDLKLEKFLLINENAENVFKKLLLTLQFNKLNSNYGKIEIYNVDKNRWDNYSSKFTSNYEYYILKVNDGLIYKILKKVGNELYEANIPFIYTKQSDDDNFKREIWRIILGLCSFNGKPAICKIKKYCLSSIIMEMNGYVFPEFENSLLKAMTWPYEKYNDINRYVTDETMRSALKELLSHLSIKVVEED